MGVREPWANAHGYPPADISIDRIGDLIDYNLPDFLATAADSSPATASA